MSGVGSEEAPSTAREPGGTDDERQRFLSDLFEHAPVGLNLCRLDGLWLQSNQAFLDMIGYTREEANGGLTYWQLTPRSYDAQEAIQLASLEETGRYGPYEKEFIRKDGTLVPVRLSGFITERDGERFIWSFIEDITERKLAERERERLEQQIMLSAKLASMGTLAAGVAHEINNPLTIAYLHLDQMRAAVRSGDRVELSAIERVQHSVERIKRIVESLRDYARPGRTREDIGETFGVNAAVSQAVELIQSIYRADGVTIELDLAASPDTVRGDVRRFQQVVMNLLANAKDAMERSEPKRLTVSSRLAGGDVRMEVTDTGEGIAAEDVGKIFDMFFTTKEVGRGTGLGLGISHAIIEELGGSIRVRSEPGHGATFTVTLPASAPATGSVAGEEEGQEPRGRGRVMIVEDEPELRRLLGTLIRSWSFETVTAADGIEAWNRLQAEAPDVVITDLKMPRMSGVELLKRARDRFGAEGPRFVVLTGDLKENHENALAPMSDVIEACVYKPEILKALPEVLDRICPAAEHRPTDRTGGS